jgi:hypothetical protein
VAQLAYGSDFECAVRDIIAGSFRQNPAFKSPRCEKQLQENLSAVGWSLTNEQIAKLYAASTVTLLSLLAPALDLYCP